MLIYKNSRSLSSKQQKLEVFTDQKKVDKTDITEMSWENYKIKWL